MMRIKTLLCNILFIMKRCPILFITEVLIFMAIYIVLGIIAIPVNKLIRRLSLCKDAQDAKHG